MTEVIYCSFTNLVDSNFGKFVDVNYHNLNKITQKHRLIFENFSQTARH